jgi:hypothetical protein
VLMTREPLLRQIASSPSAPPPAGPPAASRISATAARWSMPPTAPSPPTSPTRAPP